MWFAAALLIAFPLAAYGMAIGIARARRGRIDPDSDKASLEVRFIRRSAALLTAAMLICIPMLCQWYQEQRIRQTLQPLPLVDIMRRYQPAIYEDLVADIQTHGLTDDNVQRALTDAASKLRIAWISAVPYASTEAVMRYIRYRYDEANLLMQQDDSACIGIGIPKEDGFNLKDVEFMQKNAPYIKDAMIMVFTSTDENRLSYLDQRYGQRHYALILDSLNQSFGVNAQPYADYQGCRYQKAFYLHLLDYSDSEMSKIMRWSILKMLNEGDKFNDQHIREAESKTY